MGFARSDLLKSRIIPDANGFCGDYIPFLK
jgi:hypothetical protein